MRSTARNVCHAFIRRRGGAVDDAKVGERRQVLRDSSCGREVHGHSNTRMVAEPLSTKNVRPGGHIDNRHGRRHRNVVDQAADGVIASCRNLEWSQRISECGATFGG